MGQDSEKKVWLRRFPRPSIITSLWNFFSYLENHLIFGQKYQLSPTLSKVMSVFIQSNSTFLLGVTHFLLLWHSLFSRLLNLFLLTRDYLNVRELFSSRLCARMNMTWFFKLVSKLARHIIKMFCLCSPIFVQQSLIPCEKDWRQNHLC